MNVIIRSPLPNPSIPIAAENPIHVYTLVVQLIIPMINGTRVIHVSKKLVHVQSQIFLENLSIYMYQLASIHVSKKLVHVQSHLFWTLYMYKRKKYTPSVESYCGARIIACEI